MIGRLSVLFCLLTSATIGQIDSVVKVKDGTGGWGSGFVVSQHSDRDEKTYWGLIATARHCVVDGGGGLRVMTVEFQNGFVSENCRVAAYDSDDDCALIWAIVPDEIKPLPLRADLRIHDTIYNYGLSTGPGIDKGTVVACDEHNCYLIVVVIPGDSGGPVINEDGFVVGIVTHKNLIELENEPTARACAVMPLQNLLGVAMALDLPAKTQVVEGR